MDALQLISHFFVSFIGLIVNPVNLLMMFASVFLGIVFGALPGLTATLGVALLTTLTYGLHAEVAMISLLGVYVGAVYGGCYSSILLNIPGTAAAAATAVDGYPLAQRGEAGKVLGITTTSSAIGTFVGMLFVVAFSPIISKLALQFTSWEFFLLAFFGIIISGTLVLPDLVVKGWIAGFLGLFLAVVGRDRLQFYPRFTLGIANLEGGLDVVPILIGAFGIPQIIATLKSTTKVQVLHEVKRVLPEWKTVFHHLPDVIRSALIGVGIGSVPGIGEDIAAWTAYGAAKKASKHPENFGKGEYAAIVSTETANNACIGGALIPLFSLGIPGSPPAAMLLGALMLHGLNPGPLLLKENPTFLPNVTAILLLASISMWILGIFLTKQTIKILRIPNQLLMPLVAVLCVIGSYSIGANVFNLYLMIPVGIVAYFLTEMGYPIAPLVIGLILGPMADESLRRALMIGKGSFMPLFQRPVALLLFVIIIFTFLSQTAPYKKLVTLIKTKLASGKAGYNEP
jgi:putative tricarboxylic transport membrane protein